MTEYSQKQIQEAKDLVENDLILELDSDTWLVNSSSRNSSYEVQRIYDKPYDYYCKCTGWKFSRIEKTCKHCLAITMYIAHMKGKGN